MGPGATALTRMPRGRARAARLTVRLLIAALVDVSARLRVDQGRDQQPHGQPRGRARAARHPGQRRRAGSHLDTPPAGDPARGEDREVRAGHAPRAGRTAGRGRPGVRLPRLPDGRELRLRHRARGDGREARFLGLGRDLPERAADGSAEGRDPRGRVGGWACAPARGRVRRESDGARGTSAATPCAGETATAPDPPGHHARAGPPARPARQPRTVCRAARLAGYRPPLERSTLGRGTVRRPR